MPATESRRLFFALWPEAGAAERLARAAQSVHAVCGGRVMGQEKLHLTLVFLGEVAETAMIDLRAVAAEIAGEACALRFDGLAVRRRQGMVWATCAFTPPQLATLVADLQRGLRGMGLAVEEWAYTPHVTLLRKAREPRGALPSLEPIAWPASDFVLVESRLAASGSSYRIIGRWPLAAADRPRPAG